MRAKRSFKDSLRRLFLLHTLVPISILFVLFLMFMMINSRFLLINQTTEAGKKIKLAMEEVYSSYVKETNEASALDSVRAFTSVQARGPEVFERFYTFNNRQRVKSIMYILDTDGDILASSANYGSDSSDLALQAIARRMHNQGLTELAETNPIRFSHDRYTAYTFAKAISGSGGVQGYLIYQLYELDLQKLLFVQNNEIAVVTDPYRTIIATTNNLTQGLMNKYSLTSDSKGYVWIDDGKYYSKETYLPLSQWRIYTLSAAEGNRSAYLSLAVFFAMASLLLWIVIWYSARIISTRQSRAIDKLIYAVRELQSGNMDSYVYIGTGDEFETLANQYNQMLQRLNELVAQNTELSDLRRVIEVKHLQSQFHPHFIFNVLETLRYAIIVDNQLAQDMVLTLSRHLRYSIGNEQDHVVLGSDLEYIAGYMKLQQIRFKDRLHYREEVDQAARTALVPRLMLQPVIENTIKYGYRQRQSVAVTVLGWVEGKDLILEVKDNAGGMSRERLAEVQAIMHSQNNRAPHIGLHNLHRRLVLMYGDRYGIEVDSTQGEGTVVTFRLPYRKEETDVQGAAGRG
ncbi:sensor histidine kinase [Paenibacillus silagei]|uniref:Sensor histidine kinase YesM n=1 Tax=Paenibacillus silagei TaxID=1670801 RepID=A0ABS4NUA7_9BACL|nr:histidine kinase [Paenibacillus silagei]MBP2113046.1 sensor histidine kinase YesM [Paenibacillus silagei]